MVAPLTPTGIKTQGNVKWVFNPTSSLTVPSLATWTGDAALDVSNILYADSGRHMKETNKGQAPRRLGTTKVWEQSGTDNESFGDLRYVVDPQGSNGTNEVQTVTITGGPTGGTFTLTYSGQTTAAIAYNATAAAVQSALEALSNIGTGNVTATGGPLPGTAVTVTFVGTLAETNVGQMTATSSLTGGTTPAVTVATTTAGAAPSEGKRLYRKFAAGTIGYFLERLGLSVDTDLAVNQWVRIIPVKILARNFDYDTTDEFGELAVVQSVIVTAPGAGELVQLAA